MAAKIDAQLAPEITDDEELQALYNWVDETPLSRPKKNISRDFQDGVLFAEVVNNFFPRLVEMHNYSAANSHTQKLYNWTTLNQKVLRKLGYQIHQQDIEDIIKAAPGAIERVLKVLQEKVVQAQNGALRVGRPPAKAGSSPPDGRPTKEDGGARAGSADPTSRPRSDPGLAGNAQRYQQEVDAELLVEKEQTIAELREMVVIMSEKIKKLEQLVRIKDSKIEALTAKLQKYNLA
mmetsp:Transcript_46462/g.107243  ORF Transcript_46462/g.107243 Transcript_46462/m.107243 type:complete len:235 (-) Transcript_46462:69-773(-)|eukprot:CAMPEP_0171108380 /NCGR_PEP_ID=MMETSP0766_2-20121228/68828_1 /TAXON_ID=439317 /ORGANISM="Gambierdiscus australes, Strain CAWD 149" /LENGTH=234 /DNA_ID=CAMNT_0011569901 /DNA_START=118 /DNA_END=822 /DNA_ORIENTATION=-